MGRCLYVHINLEALSVAILLERSRMKDVCMGKMVRKQIHEGTEVEGRNVNKNRSIQQNLQGTKTMYSTWKNCCSLFLRIQNWFVIG